MLLQLVAEQLADQSLIPPSMCLYPTDSAYETAFFTSPGADCHVPRPKAGISAPVLSLNRVSAMILFGMLGVGKLFELLRLEIVGFLRGI